MADMPRELTRAEYQATFSPPMLDVTMTAEEVIDLWAYADQVIECMFHSCPAWEWRVTHIYESKDGCISTSVFQCPMDDTYLTVVVDKPGRRIIGHYSLALVTLNSSSREHGV